jgi:DNA-binding NarL/FixJ family response regulator
LIRNLIRSPVVEGFDTLGLVLAVSAGFVAWLLHVPGPVAVGVIAAVLAVRMLADVFLHRLKVRAGPPPGAPLTKTEWKVAARVAESLSNREIAVLMHVEESTIDTHTAHIREKLGYHSRTQIATWYVEQQARLKVAPEKVNTKIHTD